MTTRFLATVIAVTVLAGGPAGAPAEGAIQISTSREHVATRLGSGFSFHSTITSSGAPLTGLVAHLNIVSLTPGVYVDPEDWSSRRTVYLPALRAGSTTKISWRIDAVNGGRFAVYVVVLPRRSPASGTLAVSPAVEVRVIERRSLNSDGVLTLALGIPGLLGLLALALRMRRR